MKTTSKKAITHPGNILLAGFAAMILMMAILVYLCVRQDLPLVSKNYYEQELVYQHQIDATANAIALDIRVVKDAQYIRLSIPREISRHIRNGSVYFYYPANEKMDQVTPIEASPQGIYLFDRHLLPGDSYTVKISFEMGGKSFYKELQL